MGDPDGDGDPDDDDNTYVDDVHGWNFAANRSTPTVPYFHGTEAVSAFLAQLALAYGRAQTGDVVGAWAAWDEVAALDASREVSDPETVQATRDDLLVLAGPRPPSGALVATRPAGVAAAEMAPTRLDAPYPNPVAAGTVTVPFTLAEASSVRVVVFDVLGREVIVAASGEHSVGAHVTSVDVSSLGPGVYVVRVDAEEASRPVAATRRFTVVR